MDNETKNENIDLSKIKEIRIGDNIRIIDDILEISYKGQIVARYALKRID